MNSDAWPFSRRYVLGSLLNWVAFLGGVLLLTWGRGTGGLPLVLLWLLAIVLVASVGLQFAAAWRLIAAQDEFVRAITGKRIIVAAGVTLTVAVFAGLTIQFLSVPAVPMWLLYPLFWGVYGMVTPLIRDSRA